MMDIPHIGFILAAYAVTAVVMGGAVAAVLLDRRALLRGLARLEARAGRGRAGAPQ
jgi:heme exporter protein D